VLAGPARRPAAQEAGKNPALATDIITALQTTTQELARAVANVPRAVDQVQWEQALQTLEVLNTIRGGGARPRTALSPPKQTDGESGSTPSFKFLSSSSQLSPHTAVGLDGSIDCFADPDDRVWNGILEPGNLWAAIADDCEVDPDLESEPRTVTCEAEDGGEASREVSDDQYHAVLYGAWEAMQRYPTSLRYLLAHADMSPRVDRAAWAIDCSQGPLRSPCGHARAQYNDEHTVAHGWRRRTALVEIVPRRGRRQARRPRTRCSECTRRASGPAVLPALKRAQKRAALL
jgi:hypothetical protein